MKIRKYKKLYEDDAQQPVANATPAQPAAQQPATNTSTTIDASAPDWDNISKQVSDNLSAVLIDQIPKIVLKIIPNYGQMPEFKNAVNVWNKFKNDKTLTSFTEYMKEFYTDIDTINKAQVQAQQQAQQQAQKTAEQQTTIPQQAPAQQPQTPQPQTTPASNESFNKILGEKIFEQKLTQDMQKIIKNLF